MAVRLPRLLDANRREVCRLMPTSLSLQLQLNAASTATMTLDLRGPLPAMHSWVEIYTAKGSAGLYRVTNTAHQARRERTYTLLHGIDTLSDCVWAAQTDYTGTAEGYLRALLACQKAVYWQLGTCQDTGQWKKTGINYDKASDLLAEFVGDRHGYYMAYDFTTWPWTLHWLRLPDTVSAEWRVSRNIHSCTVTRNDADLCTRLYFCVTSTSDVGQDGSGGGTATAVQIIDNAAAQALYGIIEKTATVDTADVADTAAWAAQFMADHGEPAVQITVDGYELARQTGDPWDSFDLGKLTRCALVDDGITVNERVVGVSYPDVLGEPEHVVVDLANRLPKFSDTIASASKTAASANATAKSASRSGGGTAKKLDHWAMVVSKQQEALDGTGLTDLWETGIELDPQTGARLYSLYQGLSSNLAELRVHNNEISTLVTKTGINSLGQAETLYTKLSQTDTDLRGEIRRAEGAEDDLAALIQANADNISAALGDIEEVDGRVQSIEGSTLWMNRDSVTAATGKLVVDDQGNLHVVDGSNLYLGTGQASMGVYTDGTLTAGIIVDKINNGSVNIQGSRVNVTATDRATWGVYDNDTLTAGIIVDKINGGSATIAASKVNLTGYLFVGNSGNFSGSLHSTDGNITAHGQIGGASLSGQSITLDGEQLTSYTLSFMSNLWTVASDGNIDLAHYHDIEVTENNGVITITQGAAQSTPGSDSFNIADTQFYRDAVASAKNAMGVQIDQANQSVVVAESATKSALIASTVNLIYNTNNHKYTATTAATANGTTLHTNAAVSGTEAYDAGEGVGYTAGYSEGVNDGYLTGWNAAVAAITRNGNSIIGPAHSDGSSYTTETKYTANYTPSAYTQETHRYTPSTYVAESHSYTPSSYTRETTVYNTATVLISGSSHSHSNAWIKQDSGSRIYNDTILNLSGDHSVQFDSGSDSYTKETTSTIGYYRIASGSSYTPSAHSYTASVYDAETHSYTPSSYTGSSFSWS